MNRDFEFILSYFFISLNILDSFNYVQKQFVELYFVKYNFYYYH